MAGSAKAIPWHARSSATLARVFDVARAALAPRVPRPAATAAAAARPKICICAVAVLTLLFGLLYFIAFLPGIEFPEAHNATLPPEAQRTRALATAVASGVQLHVSELTGPTLHDLIVAVGYLLEEKSGLAKTHFLENAGLVTQQR